MTEKYLVISGYFVLLLVGYIAGKIIESMIKPILKRWMEKRRAKVSEDVINKNI